MTVKQVNRYYDLVTEGKAEPLRLLGAEGFSRETLLIPSLDENDVVYFDDMMTGLKIYPGPDSVKKILKALDTA